MYSNIQPIFFVCCLKYFKVYTFLQLQTVFTAHIEVYSDVTDNGGCLKQPNYQWRPFKTVKFQIHDG